jgi:hypothetical protein
MNRILFLFTILVVNSSFVTASEEAPETIWVENEKVLKCVPARLKIGESLNLELGKHHGKELSVYRQSENLDLFLVVGSPPVAMESLMTPTEFEKVSLVTLTSSSTGFRWDVKGGNETIFNSPGIYTFYVSENLESEQGGYKCEVLVVRP